MIETAYSSPTGIICIMLHAEYLHIMRLKRQEAKVVVLKFFISKFIVLLCYVLKVCTFI